ncbi:MAG: hypothetical protein KGP28_08585 [Bdellovibrionales bacterium]|nr:hypothetical protein [Bdellovibrionales bacterium]
MKFVFVFSFFLILNSGSSAFAQDKPESDFAQDLKSEERLLVEERRILSEVLDEGQLDESFLKGYPKILREVLEDEVSIHHRVRVLSCAIEAGLIYQSRADFAGSQLEELENKIKHSPVSIEIRNRVLDFEDKTLGLARMSDQPERPKSKGRKGEFYVMWGYNRTWFGKTDSTFKTPEGEFTIHDSVGKDRPTPFDPKIYFNPTKMSIPQYNLTLGYWFKDRVGVEIGQDHMKWVFDNSLNYSMSGSFSPTLFVPNPDAQYGWDGVRPVSFEEVKKTGDARWLSFEHTNGYNYVFAALVFLQPLYQGPKGRIALDSRWGAGAGVMIPQTSVHMHRDQAWNWQGYDNKFHLAGGGGHTSGSLRVTAFDRVFLEATARASLIKVSNALVDPSGAVLTQTPIAAFELMGQIGYQGPLVRHKRGRR